MPVDGSKLLFSTSLVKRFYVSIIHLSGICCSLKLQKVVNSVISIAALPVYNRFAVVTPGMSPGNTPGNIRQ